jgi:hypothetical protein
VLFDPPSPATRAGPSSARAPPRLESAIETTIGPSRKHARAKKGTTVQ